MEVEGNEDGFDGTIWADGNKEQDGKGLDPQSPWLPEKLRSPNLVLRFFGKFPERSLLDKLNSISEGSEARDLGIWPESSLFCRRRVRRRVRLEKESGTGPLRLLLERSNRRRRVREENVDGIASEKSLPER